jgi:hypothetical protein
MALAIVGSACGSPGRRHRRTAGPHDRVPGLAFQPIGLADLCLGNPADKLRFPKLAIVQPVRVAEALGLGLTIAAGQQMLRPISSTISVSISM